MTILRYIHWKPEESERRADDLRALGYAVNAAPFDPRSARSPIADQPAAYVIDLSRLPSSGRDVGVLLRMNRTSRMVPLVFLGGEADKVDRVKRVLPDAYFCTWDTVDETLAQALTAAVEKVIVPESAFAGYAGTPLHQKLGIRPGMSLGLLHAPPDFEVRLGELPFPVSFQRDDTAGCALVVWFATQQAQLAGEFPAVLSRIDPGTVVWAAWPKKGSAVPSDLAQPLVRKAGLALDWVDYKVCSIDETWTGLCFTRRKPRQD